MNSHVSREHHRYNLLSKLFIFLNFEIRENVIFCLLNNQKE